MQFQVSDITVEIIPPRITTTPEDDKEYLAKFIYKIAEMNQKRKY